MDGGDLAFLHPVSSRQGSRHDASFCPYGVGCLSIGPTRRRSGKMVRATSSSRMVGKNTFAVGDSGCRSESGTGQGGNWSGLSSRGLWAVAESRAGALQPGILSMEDPRPTRLVATLSFAWFHRTVGIAMALERGFCGFAHCRFLFCQAPLARRSDRLGLLRGVADPGQWHCHLRPSAGSGSLQLSAVPRLGDIVWSSRISLLETLDERPRSEEHTSEL